VAPTHPRCPTRPAVLLPARATGGWAPSPSPQRPRGLTAQPLGWCRVFDSILHPKLNRSRRGCGLSRQVPARCPWWGWGRQGGSRSAGTVTAGVWLGSWHGTGWAFAGGFRDAFGGLHRVGVGVFGRERGHPRGQVPALPVSSQSPKEPCAGTPANQCPALGMFSGCLGGGWCPVTPRRVWAPRCVSKRTPAFACAGRCHRCKAGRAAGRARSCAPAWIFLVGWWGRDTHPREAPPARPRGE